MFLTAINDETTKLKGFRKGDDDYVAKPVRTRVFVRKVDELFRRVKKAENKIKV